MKHLLGTLACAGCFLAMALNHSQANPPTGEWKTMYGVEIKQKSSSDPWVRIAKYDTWAEADARVVLMMRHGGQAAVQIAEFREFVPARIIATPTVGKVLSPVQTRKDSGLIGKTLDAPGNRGIIIVGGRLVNRHLTLPTTAIPRYRAPVQLPLRQPAPTPR